MVFTFVLIAVIGALINIFISKKPQMVFLTSLGLSALGLLCFWHRGDF